MSVRILTSIYHKLSVRGCKLLAVCAIGSMAYVVPAWADTKGALPASVADLKLTHAPQVYSPATLESHIDGEAEAVKHYDFKECAYGEYAVKGQGNPVITADIYQMGDATNAWGYYSGQQNASAKEVVVSGAHGYQETSALNFWKGAYYIKLTITSANTAAFQPVLPKLATAIAAKLTGSTTIPDIVKLLPSGYKPRTEKYSRSDIAAQSYIRNGVIANYPAAGPQAELFIAIYGSPAAAKDAFAKYQKSLTEPSKMAVGAKPSVLKGIGESAIGVKSKFTGEVVAALKGKYLIGVRKAKDPAGAQTLAKAAVAHAK